MNNRKQNVVAIIPARGGSKGLPGKNIRDLCGKPLIAYSIEPALKSQLIDRVIVSTEDAEIADISRNYGAEVPFLRPAGLAGDHSHLGDVLSYTINQLKETGYYPFIMVVLFVTSPFKSMQLIDFLVSKLLEGASVIETVKKVHHSNLTIYSKNGSGRITSLLNNNSVSNKIEAKTFYRPYGVFSGTNFYSAIHKPYLYVIKNDISLVDIDTFADFCLAEEIIKQGLFNFEQEDSL